MHKSIQLILHDIAQRHTTLEQCKQDAMYKFYVKYAGKKVAPVTYITNYYENLYTAQRSALEAVPKYF